MVGVGYSSTCVIFTNKIVRGRSYHFSNFKKLRKIEFQSHVQSHAAVEISTGCNHAGEPERLTFVITVVFPLSPQSSAGKSSQLLPVGKQNDTHHILSASFESF